MRTLLARASHLDGAAAEALRDLFAPARRAARAPPPHGGGRRPPPRSRRGARRGLRRARPRPRPRGAPRAGGLVGPAVDVRPRPRRGAVPGPAASGPGAPRLRARGPEPLRAGAPARAARPRADREEGRRAPRASRARPLPRSPDLLEPRHPAGCRALPVARPPRALTARARGARAPRGRTSGAPSRRPRRSCRTARRWTRPSGGSRGCARRPARRISTPRSGARTRGSGTEHARKRPARAPRSRPGTDASVDPAVLDPRKTREPLSASSLEKLAKCPRMYFYEYVLDLAPPDEARREDEWLNAREFGNLLHETLYDFMAALRSDGLRLDPARDAARLRAVAGRRLARWKEIVPPPNLAAFRTQEDEVLAACDIFLRAEASNTATPKWFEVPFGLRRGKRDEPLGSPDPVEIGTPGGSFLLQGQIDRIDEAGPGRYEVWDYKSGGDFAFKEEGRTARPLNGGRLLQHALYRRAAREPSRRAGERPRRRSPRAISCRPARAGCSASRWRWPTPRSTGRLNDLFSLVASGSFPHTADSGDCKFCPFRAICGDVSPRGQRAGGQARRAGRRPPPRARALDPPEGRLMAREPRGRHAARRGGARDDPNRTGLDAPRRGRGRVRQDDDARRADARAPRVRRRARKRRGRHLHAQGRLAPEATPSRPPSRTPRRRRRTPHGRRASRARAPPSTGSRSGRSTPSARSSSRSGRSRPGSTPRRSRSSCRRPRSSASAPSASSSARAPTPAAPSRTFSRSA